MKKNIAMRVAAFLFILTMISTCAFATTFAKYTTSDSANDSARVAKWGVNVDVAIPTDGAFKVTYDSAANPSVKGASNAKVVAPGTRVDDALTVTITGTPEVDVKIEYEATVTLEGWEEGSYTLDGATQKTHCPLVIKVNDTPYKVEAGKTAADLAAAVKAAIEAKSVANINAGTELDSTNNLTVSWAWDFGPDSGANDANDTALGNLTIAPTISISVTCTVTQID